jgi:hypothetical protein
MRVECEISDGEEANDNEIVVECVYAECTRCGHETMSFGDSDASVRRCLAVMREEWPKGESNFYVTDDEA